MIRQIITTPTLFWWGIGGMAAICAYELGRTLAELRSLRTVVHLKRAARAFGIRKFREGVKMGRRVFGGAK